MHASGNSGVAVPDVALHHGRHRLLHHAYFVHQLRNVNTLMCSEQRASISVHLRRPTIAHTSQLCACRASSHAVPDSSEDPDDMPAEQPTTSGSATPQKPRKRPFSHALNSNFATDELMEELKDRESFGKRGELVLVAQLVCIFLVIFPPMRLQGVIYLAGVSYCCRDGARAE